MIRHFRQASANLGSRRWLAVLTVFWLNLALLPCAMAIEVAAEGHDCCPPSIELQPSDCCELAAVTLDHRDNKVESPDSTFVPAADNSWPSLNTFSNVPQVANPPDPGNHSPPLHKLFCVYLK